jgi:hypothetical protein
MKAFICCEDHKYFTTGEEYTTQILVFCDSEDEARVLAEQDGMSPERIAEIATFFVENGEVAIDKMGMDVIHIS